MCRKMAHLSRGAHLWVIYFNRTKDAPCPPLDLGQIGTVEFERVICQTDTLERIWSDRSILQAAPRPRRFATRIPDMPSYRTAVGIMGEYIILECGYSQITFSWVSMHDRNEPAVVLEYDTSPRLPIFARCYMDLITTTFYVVLMGVSDVL